MLQGLPKIFRGNIISLVPLAFQRAMFVGKNLDYLLEHLRYQGICLLDRNAGFIHKLALDLIPARSKRL